MQPADSRLTEIATLLRAAGAAHHRAFAAVNGADEDWPRWYAAYLAPPLGRLLGVAQDEAALARWLAELDRSLRSRSPSTPWPEYYAERLLRLPIS